MGIQSQHRKSGIRACKNRSRRSRYSSRKTKRPTQKQEAILLADLYKKIEMKQSTLWGRAAPPTVGNGGIVCDGCRFGPTYKKGHHITCHFSKYYGMNKARIEKELEKANAPKPSPITYHAQPARLRVDFITGKTMSRTVPSTDKENAPPMVVIQTMEEEAAKEAAQEIQPIADIEDTSPTFPDVNDDSDEVSSANHITEDIVTDEVQEVLPDAPINIYDTVSARALKASLKSRLAKKCPPYMAKCSRALFEMSKHLLEMLPSKFDSKSNKMLGGAENKKKLMWYNTHFPAGRTCFEIPQESCLEEPFMPYSSIVGTKLYILRWELQDPSIFLGCTKADCCGELIHDRFDLTKNGQMTPIICAEGRPAWVISMKYCCDTCSDICYAHEGRLLNTLPKWMQASFPVLAKYSTTQLLLSRSTSDLLDRMMITYGNGPMLARFIHERMGKEYLVHEMSYYEQCGTNNIKDATPFPCFQDWLGDLRILPSGEQLRDIFDKSHKSDLTLSGVSDDMRHTREIQSVGSGGVFCHDHTHQTLKNYQSSLGAKGVWDASNKGGEIMSVVIVPTTKVSDIVHAAEGMARRPNFRDRLEEDMSSDTQLEADQGIFMYSDTWPANDVFWTMLFPDLQGRLGSSIG